MYEKQILIAGAGPTGLTLAIDLARRGVAFRIVEAVKSPFEGSRGKGIQPRTLEIFDSLGIVEAILAAGQLYPRLRVHVGRLSLRVGSLGSRKDATERTPYPNLWMVSQAHTEAIMRERLRALGGAVEFGVALESFTQDGSGIVATLSTGEEVRAAYLVGADGGRSRVRRVLGLGLTGNALEGGPMLIADVEVEGLDRRDWHIWPLAKGGAAGLCPLPNTSLFQLTCRAGTSQAGIEERIRKVTGHRVTRVAWESVYQPAVRMVSRYRVGRVFLAGDAAHLHPPEGGQGLNTGVQDAYNLGWKLGVVLRGGPDALLDTYEAERLPIAAAVLRLSKQLHQTRSLKRGEATNQLGLHYRESPLSARGSLGELQPGDRMPDARLENGSRLFEQLRDGRARELVTSEGIRVLIRPDGYIAQIGGIRSSEYLGEPVAYTPGKGRSLFPSE